MASGPPQSAPPTERIDRLRLALVVMLGVALLLPIGVVLARVAGTNWLLTSDHAGIDLRSRDVFSVHIPLIGAYDRYWSHPGPLMFWVLAPFATIGGGAWATVVGTAVVQTAAIAVAAWLAWRRGGLWLLLVVALLAALSYRTLNADPPIISVWNPTIAFPFFVLFLVVIALSVTGSPRMLIAATAVGSFLVQAHIGYTPLVAALGLWAAIVVVVDEHREAGTVRTRRLRQIALWSGAVALVLWIGPLIDAALHRGGNLKRIARYFTGNGEPVPGLRRGAEFFAAEFRWPPAWLVGHETLDSRRAVQPASILLLIIPVALLAVGFAATRISRSIQHRRLMTMAAILCLVSVFALSRTRLPAYSAYFLWIHIAALFVILATGIAVVGAIGSTRLRRVSTLGVVLLAVCVTVTSVSIATATNASIDDAKKNVVAIRTLLPLLEKRFPAHGTVLVRSVGDQKDLWGAMIDELARRGFDVRVDPSYPYETEFGSQRTANPSEVDQVWVVAEGRRPVNELAARASDRAATTVARFSPSGHGGRPSLVVSVPPADADRFTSGVTAART